MEEIRGEIGEFSRVSFKRMGLDERKNICNIENFGYLKEVFVPINGEKDLVDSIMELFAECYAIGKTSAMLIRNMDGKCRVLLWRFKKDSQSHDSGEWILEMRSITELLEFKKIVDECNVDIYGVMKEVFKGTANLSVWGFVAE